MINQQQIDQVKAIDCRDLIGGFFPLSGKGKEWEGPCPWCGGTDRFHVTAGGWFCREGGGHCGRKGDSIRFIQEHKQLSFPQAIDFLLQWQGSAPLPSVRPDREKSVPATDWRGDGWQWLASQEVRITCSRLAEGLPYLASRGITEATAGAYRLGYTSQGYYGKNDIRPAITIPWYNGDLITAVRYRFLRPDPEGLRYRLGMFPKNASGATGSMALFRPPARRSGVAIFCEGELNAISIYQATTFDPYAVGSQSVTDSQIEAVRQVATGYGLVIVWLDEEKAARKVAAAIPGTIMVKSVKKVIDGKEVKFDANELLQTGQLAEFLDRWVSKLTPTGETESLVAQPDREEADPLTTYQPRAEALLLERDTPGILRGAACRLLDYLDGHHSNRESTEYAASLITDHDTTTAAGGRVTRSTNITGALTA